MSALAYSCGKEVEAFSSAASWTTSNGSAADDALTRWAAPSLKLVNDAGLDLTTTKTVAIDSTMFRSAQLWVYVPDPEKLSLLTIRLGSTANLSAFFGTTVSGFRRGWNNIPMYTNSWQAFGGIAWGTTNH